MKKILSVMLITIVFNVIAEAQVIRSQKSNINKYSTYLKNKKLMSYVDYYDLNRAKNNSYNRLILELFKTAKEHLYKGQNHLAMNQFKKIVNQRHSYDYPKSIRKLVFASYIQLYQLENNNFNKENHLKNSLIYTQEFLKIKLAHHISEKLKLINKQINIIEFRDLNNLKDYDIAYINGQKINLNKTTLKWPLGKIRISLVSNTLFPTFKIINSNEVPNIFFEKKFMVTKACGQVGPKNLKALLPLPSLVFYSYHCVKPRKELPQKNTVAKVEKIQNFKIKPVSAYEQLKKRKPNYLSLDTSATLHTKRASWYKNKWVWISVGVLSYGIIKSQQSINSPATKPIRNTGVYTVN